jgi:ferredoxin
MDSIEKLIHDKARELLQSGAVNCVMGYERATDGQTARPLFAYTPEEAERFIFDQYCTHNLARYLINMRDKPVGIVAKPCDTRAINLLLNEKQIEREKVYVIGVACQGIMEAQWGAPTDKLELRCYTCPQPSPVLYDFLAGELQPEPAVEARTYTDVVEMEGKPVAERRDFWQEQFNRCIRCYACRQSCVGCYCQECFVDELDPLWVGIKVAPAENATWNTIRAFHLAGRCIACNECERVCPVNIPLSLLNRKLEKDGLELFQFQAGMDDSVAPPFATIKKGENLGIGD